MRTVIMLLALTVTTPAFAEEHYSKGYVVRPEFTAGDWTLSFFAGNVGGVLTGLFGGTVGYAMAGECTSGCFLHGLTESLVGTGVGSIFGGAAGIYLVGQARGHRGSYWAAAGGWSLGLAIATGLAVDADHSGSADYIGVAIAAVVLLPALGGTAGYVLSLDKGTPGPVPVGGLLEVHDGTPRLSVPNVDLKLDQAGAFERVDVTLVGGRF